VRLSAKHTIIERRLRLRRQIRKLINGIREFHAYLFAGGSAATLVTFVKAIDATRRIDQFLFTGEERMTFRANFDMQLLSKC
jgi:hypothetical protein